jgi:ribosomal protein L3 glutamine methyltransferase
MTAVVMAMVAEEETKTMDINYFSEARGTLKTVRDCFRFAVSRFTEAELFFGHGSDTASDEAAYLILHTLHLPLDQLTPFLDAQLTQSELIEILELVKKRVDQRIPVAYLTNQALLGDFSFYVDERVIVPRSFIAELLRERLSPWIAEPEEIDSVLDMCTGSGCLAILAAHAFPNARVDAVDLSPDALDVAQYNVSDYELEDRIELIESNLFNNLQGQRYDLIISNPPYVDAPSVAALPREYLHEPELALGSGEDGLDATRKILAHAAEHLTDNGILIVEIGHNRDALEAAYPDLPFTWLDVNAGDEYVFMLHRNDLR